MMKWWNVSKIWSILIRNIFILKKVYKKTKQNKDNKKIPMQLLFMSITKRILKATKFHVTLSLLPSTAATQSPFLLATHLFGGYFVGCFFFFFWLLCPVYTEIHKQVPLWRAKYYFLYLDMWEIFKKTGCNKQNSGLYLCSNPQKSRTMLVYIAKRIKVADGIEVAD